MGSVERQRHGPRCTMKPKEHKSGQYAGAVKIRKRGGVKIEGASHRETDLKPMSDRKRNKKACENRKIFRACGR